ncbi:peptidyl-prolyl cis-trans isomerase FKBP16-2 [Carex littledalei]|uniref:peptidylprolyl isomerase n=1 Tax=Carex littledalei TaxID=544730 RepID=A0A833V8Z2_9POAL|nr:peptidyl-prolyl cis-trans isomerase FKBP16-2 [Carex littledalei]
MAISMLSLPKPAILPSFRNPQKNPHFVPKSTSSPSTSLPEETSPCISYSRRRLIELGIGVLAFPILSVPDANATRIQYYATVGEKLCDMNFVKSGLGFCDVSIGTGIQPPRGELINIHYTARFADGIVFDSSYKRARPLTLRIGVGKVLPGLDQGILGGGGVPPMLAGGKRKLMIPPLLAYGPEPAGCFSGDCNIPANATLLYDILFIGIYK